MTTYQICKTVYHAVVPTRLRDPIYRATPAPLNKVRSWLTKKIEITGLHDELYDSAYYAKHVEPAMAKSADTIAASLIEWFSPSSVVDVGCGTGSLLLALERIGVRCKGYEYAAAAIEICRGRGVNVDRFDIENDPFPDVRADVVISTEVAEHLPEQCADRFVDLLCSLSTKVVLTAAVPGQEGTDHVNEQPHSYWIAKFRHRGFGLRQQYTAEMRERWQSRGVVGHLTNNLMVFCSTSEVQEASAQPENY